MYVVTHYLSIVDESKFSHTKCDQKIKSKNSNPTVIKFLKNKIQNIFKNNGQKLFD